MAAADPAADSIRFRLNGVTVTVPGPGARPLGPMLREEHGLTGVKLACDDGTCGLCSVLVDGQAVRACRYPVGEAEGHVVVTVEGLHAQATLNRIQRAFLKWGVPQCGFCAPAMLIAATELLGSRARPSEAEIRAALSGVLCRCTGYGRIVAAVAEAVGEVEMPRPPAAGRAVGHDVPAIDGYAKVTGGLAFAADAVPPAALWLRLVTARRAPAHLSFGPVAPLLAAHPGLRAVLTAGDLPAGLAAAMPFPAAGRIEFLGQPVAAVIGSRAALAAISDAALPIRYRPVPETAAPPLAVAERRHGAPEAAFAAAARIAEGLFALETLAPAPIEIAAGWAEKRADGLDLHLALRSGGAERRLLAAALGLPLEKVRIVPPVAAGGFGARDIDGLALLLGFAAWTLDRPVALSAAPLVPAAKIAPRLRVTARLAAARDGRLLAAESDSHLAAGAVPGSASGLADGLAASLTAGLAAQGAAGPYPLAAASAAAHAFADGAPPLGASRGLGAVEATIWREALIDDLAAGLGLDRLDIRRRNAAGAPGLAACLAALAPRWRQAAEDVAACRAAGDASGGSGGHGRPIHGLGLGVAGGRLDLGTAPPAASVRIALERSGCLRLESDAEDTGQGLATALVQIAADDLGLAMADFVFAPSAERAGTAVAAPCLRGAAAFRAAAAAAAALKAKLLDLVQGAAGARLELADGMLRAVAGKTVREIALARLPADGAGVVAFAEAREAGDAMPAFAAHLALVEVDPAQGSVRVVRIVAAQDFGHAVHPAQAAGQIEGAIAQAVGYATMAPLIAKIGGGRSVANGLWSPIPRLDQVPAIEILPVAASGEKAADSAGAKSIGPWAAAAGAAAILGAVRHATGLPLRELPLTPEHLRAALAGHRR